MPSRSCQDGGIVFGDWKLFPLDDRNWELCHRHAVADTTTARRAGTVGEVKWHRLGRFYSWNTFANALGYAADCELKEGCKDAAMGLDDALDRYEEIVGHMATDVIAAVDRALEGRSDG